MFESAAESDCEQSLSVFSFSSLFSSFPLGFSVEREVFSCLCVRAVCGRRDGGCSRAGNADSVTS